MARWKPFAVGLLALCVAVLGGGMASAAGAAGGTVATDYKAVVGGQATASATGIVLSLNAPPGLPNRISVFMDSNGRFVVDDPNMGSFPPECQQDSLTSFSCPPGFVGALVGSMGDQDDTFSAAPNVHILIGAVVNGKSQLFAGGTGSDRITGGSAGDGLEGSAGTDVVSGGAGKDLAQGGAGNDRVLGNGGADFLFGGGGRDLLNGGNGADRCAGGGGRDRPKSCELFRTIP